MLSLEQNFDLQIKYVATSLFDTAEIHHQSLLPSK
jgi:hypothetical protein